MTELEKLRQQILSQWGNTGDWNMAGVDRAAELAQLLSQSGVTSLDDLKLQQAKEEYIPTYNEWGEMNLNTAPTQTRDAYQLAAGDRTLGYLGNVGDEDSAKSYLETVEGREPAYRLGGSAAGDGWTSFEVVPGADGQFQVVPKWGSSNNADEFMKAALAVSAPVAAWSMGLGMPVAAEAAGAGGGLSTMTGLPAVPEALAPLSQVPGAGTLPALAATPVVPSLAGAGVGAGAAALGAGGLLKLGAAALGAVAGSRKSDDTTATNTRAMDPRIDQRVFGDGGLLSLVDKQLAANPTGQNATMVQGQNMLRGLLTNPELAQGLGGQMRQGQAMLSAGIAPNPFVNWKFPGGI